MPFAIRIRPMNRSALLADLIRAVGETSMLHETAALRPYACDGFPIAEGMPLAVVFPTDTQQVAACVRAIAKHRAWIVPRGTGTGLTGGCVGFERGVIVETSRMTRILDVDLVGRWACVEAGVINEKLTIHVQSLPGGEGLHFAPDPSSQKASTIGGNAATCAGGLHTLKHGVTTQHILGLEAVLADGTVLTTRPDGVCDGYGPDLTALLCGSEGTLALITKLWVKLSPAPHAFRTLVAIFDASAPACRTVTAIIASGIVPAALEMMDGQMVRVVEEAFGYGFPTDAGAMLLIELDGAEPILDEQLEQVQSLCAAQGARDMEASSDPARRAQLWSARKRAFGAIGRISPGYCTQDACVPRSKLAEAVERITAIGRDHQLTINNVFHAGDGNVHPILLFDGADPEQVRRVMEASHAILDYCISIGGTISGEHGIGVEKLPMMSHLFSDQTMATFAGIKLAFDPQEQLNPGKKIPSKKLQVNLLEPMQANTPGGAL